MTDVEFETLRSAHDGFRAPSFYLDLSENELHSRDGVVSGLTVTSEIGAPSQCTFTLTYPFDFKNGRFEGIDWGVVAPNAPLRVFLGYGATPVKGVDPVFVGRLDSVQLRFPNSGPPSIHVTAFDYLHELTKHQPQENWQNATDADIVEDIVKKYPFAATEIESTEERRRKVRQQKATDFGFVSDLAKRNGFEIFAHGETFYFRNPAYTAEPRIDVQYGGSLASFSIEQSESEAVGEVRVRHWNPETKERIEGIAKGPASAAGVRVYTVPVPDEKSAEREAESILARLLDGYVRGQGETVGLPEMRVGESVSIRGIDAFTRGGAPDKSDPNPAEKREVYYLTRVTHSTGTDGYTTAFDVTEYVS